MLLHTTTEVRDTFGGGEILRVRVPVPAHLVGKPTTSLNVDGQIIVAGVSRGGKGFLPSSDSTMQEGDFLIVMVGKDHMEDLEAMLQAPAEHH
jgi:trk system potassium uptake protein TrkA